MVRALAAVILGYLGMALWVMMALGIAWQLLGEDFAVDPQTNRATAAWIALNLPLSFLGALLGGWLTASIARAKADSAVRALASLVVVLGLAMAFTTTFRDDSTPQVAEDVEQPSSADSTMMQAEQPVWYTFLVPFVGLAGVMIGGTIRRRASSS